MYHIEDKATRDLYHELLQSKERLDAATQDCHKEMAILKMYVNKLINLDTYQINKLELQRVMVIKNLVDSQSKLIREQRIYGELLEKSIDRKLKQNHVSVEVLNEALTKVTSLIVRVVPYEKSSELIVSMNEIINEAKQNSGLIGLE